MDTNEAPVGKLVAEIPYYTFSHRKDLLLITRVRGDPNHYPLRFHLEPSHAPCPVHTPVPVYPPLSTRGSYNCVYSLTGNDFTNSLISLLIRSIPPAGDAQRWELEEFMKSYVKEFHATQRQDRPPVLNYSSWFNYDDHHLPIHDLIPARPALSKSIHDNILLFKRRIGQRVILPRYSRKTLSVETQELLGIKRATGVDYIRHYHRTGHLTGGRMELRQTFGYNDLTPRSYFCGGGIVIGGSLYAQEIFMLLTDTFEVTHRKNRFNLGRLAIDGSEDLWIYDYSSFTSNMAEIKYFLFALGVSCLGTTILVYDVRAGVLEIDLGEYILAYNRTCNHRAAFYIGPVMKKRLGVEGDFHHEVAGALGVYGNIASCTVLHGLCLNCITGSSDKCSCVGDDGMGIFPIPVPQEIEDGEVIEPLSTPAMIKDTLRLLGDINDRKFCVLGPPGDNRLLYSYLKRSLEREIDYLWLGEQDHLVNLDIFTRIMAPQSLRGNAGGSMYRLQEIFASSVQSFMLRLFRGSFDDNYLKYAAQYLNSIYRVLELPKQGSPGYWKMKVTQGKMYSNGQGLKDPVIGSTLMCIPDSSQWYYLRQDPFARFSAMYPRGNYRIPVLVWRANYPSQDINTDVVASISEGLYGKGVKLLADLGYLAVEDVTTDTEDTEEALSVYLNLRSRQYSVLRRVTVIRVVPVTHVDLLHY